MKLAIGTAQFGMSYGVSNKYGQVSPDSAKEIINIAKKLGVDTVDTAIAYGNSESTLGYCDTKGVRIVTKIPKLPGNLHDPKEWVRQQVKESLARCRKNNLYAVLMHSVDDLRTKDGTIIYDILKKLQYEGLIEKTGVSVYSPEQLEGVIDQFKIDLVQIPLNPLDQRFESSGMLTQLNLRGIEIHVRSVFLQGLLLMPSATLPKYFSKWSLQLEEWRLWAVSNNLSPLQACIGHALSFDKIGRIVIGIENTNQLREITSAFSGRKIRTPPCFSTEDVGLINPSLWDNL